MDNVFLIAIIGIIAVVLCLLLVVFVRKAERKRAKTLIAQIIRTRGRLNMLDLEKETGAKISFLKKMLYEVRQENSDLTGFFVNNNQEFVSEKFLLSWIQKLEKVSLFRFSSELGISEASGKEIIKGLIQKEKLSGTFTTDEENFITEQRIIEEIQGRLHEGN